MCESKTKKEVYMSSVRRAKGIRRALVGLVLAICIATGVQVFAAYAEMPSESCYLECYGCEMGTVNCSWCIEYQEQCFIRFENCEYVYCTCGPGSWCYIIIE
jgi:hypothetical protein